MHQQGTTPQQTTPDGPQRSTRRRAAVLVLQGSLLAAALAVPALWVTTDKTVTLVVDGQARTVSTHSRSVAGVLEAAHLTTAQHDLLAPASGASVSDGSRVELRHGRQVTVTVDGEQRTVWVTALTVDEALGELGLDGDGAYLSASRSRPLQLTGDAFEIREAHHVTVAVDGATKQLTTNAATVKDVLAEAGVTLGENDTVDKDMAAYPTEGLAVSVTRIGHDTRVDTIALPFASTTVDDPNSYVGTSTVTTPGQDGVRVVTYALTYTNGQLTASTQVSDVTSKEPVTQVTAVGSKAKPKPVSAYGTAPAGSGYDVGDGLNWYALAACESGNNPRSVGGGGAYLGLYQFSQATWNGVGGSGSPLDASVHEQTWRAHLLYQQRGRSSWPTCGGNL